MARKNLCLKSYLKCADNKTLSKTRRKMNKKSHKRHVYGMDWGATGDGMALGESDAVGMHDGNIPGVFSATTLGGVAAAGGIGRSDSKGANRRKGAKKLNLRQWLTYHNQAEEEEDDEETSLSKFVRDLDLDDIEELDFDDDDRPEHDWDNIFDPFRDDDVEEIEDENDDDGSEYGDFGDEPRREPGPNPDFDDVDFDFDDDAFNNDCENNPFDDDFDNEDDGFDHISVNIVSRPIKSKRQVNSVGDDIIDELDADTGVLSKWWRERNTTPKHKSKFSGEEEQEMQLKPAKIDMARNLFQSNINHPGITRAEIINSFTRDLGVTQSTAVSYYERLAKEAGLTGKGKRKRNARFNLPGFSTANLPMYNNGQQGQFDPNAGKEEEPEGYTSDDPNKQGIIRTVDNAHLVYKRQAENGTYDELWTYNVGDGINDELTIRRAILAGTDIPQNKTQSDDGSQSYTLTTMGNAQILHIAGLTN